MSSLPKVICKFNTLLLKNLLGLSEDLDKFTLKCRTRNKKSIKFWKRGVQRELSLPDTTTYCTVTALKIVWLVQEQENPQADQRTQKKGIEGASQETEERLDCVVDGVKKSGSPYIENESGSLSAICKGRLQMN